MTNASKKRWSMVALLMVSCLGLMPEVRGADEARKLPSAVMLKRAPDRSSNGERAWPELDPL